MRSRASLVHSARVKVAHRRGQAFETPATDLKQVAKKVALAIGMAAATIFLALYGAIVESRRDFAILRALGAGRHRILLLVLLQTSIVACLGIAFGFGLGHLAAYLLSASIQDARGIQLVLGISFEELAIAPIVLLGGLGAGLIPALMAYRAEAVRNLAPL